MQNCDNNLDWFQLEKFTENELKIIFLQCYGQNISSNDFNDDQKIDSLYNKTLDQIYESLQKSSQKTFTSQKISENLLQFQKQVITFFFVFHKIILVKLTYENRLKIQDMILKDLSLKCIMKM
ncbi:hypothetical protein ABPG74_013983 [Tetrahymena malaccensis]